VAGDEDDRQLRTEGVELLVQFEAAHLRHAHVEDEAAVHALAVCGEETVGRVVAGDGIALAFEQPRHRVAHGLVVVDDVDGLQGMTHQRLFPPRSVR